MVLRLLSNNAPPLFEVYIQRMVKEALQRIEAANDAVPALEDRELAVNALNYAHT